MTDSPDPNWRRRRIALQAFLATHHGVISSAELRSLGISANATAVLVRDATLVRVTRGVYRAGAATLEGHSRLRADLLQAGPQAALTLRSAGHLLGHLKYAPVVTQIVVPGRSGFKRSADLERHTDAAFEETEIVDVDSLRCRSPYATILSLAADADSEGALRVLRRVLRGAAAEDPALTARLRAAIDDGVYGAPVLREELKGGLERTLVVRSAVEDRFVELCKRYDLPIPWTNVVVHGIELDNHWPEFGAWVEVDTYGTHGDEVTFERDHEKAATLARLGLRGFHVTDRRIDHQPAAVARDLRGLLRLE